MRWSFPILSRFIPGLGPKVEVDPDQGVPRPAYPPPIYPNDPGYEYEMHGTYANKLGNTFNVVYWPDFKLYSYHHAKGAAQGHSAKREWYATKEEAVAKIESGQ